MELEQGKSTDRADVAEYLANLPDTPRKYLSREVPIYLDNRKTTISALAEKVGVSRNSLSSIVNSNNIESDIHANIAGCLIQEVAPPGLRKKVLEQYYPWIRDMDETTGEQDEISGDFLADLLSDPATYSIYNQSQLGEGITEDEIIRQWGTPGVAQMEILVKLGAVKQTLREGGDTLYSSVFKGNFRTITEAHVADRIRNCSEYVKKFKQSNSTRTMGTFTGLFDEKAQKEIKELTFQYSKKIAEIRSRPMGPDAKKMFLAFLTGEFFPTEGGS